MLRFHTQVAEIAKGLLDHDFGQGIRLRYFSAAYFANASAIPPVFSSPLWKMTR